MEYILAYWLSAWILSIIRLMIPALKLIRILDKNNIVVRRKVTGFISSLIISRIACIIKKIGIKKATLPNILSNDEDKKEPKVPK